MKDDNCIFCKLANGDIPTTTIFEDGDFRVIPDAGPASFGHLLIIPKEHAKDLTELPKDVRDHLDIHLLKQVDEALNLLLIR